MDDAVGLDLHDHDGKNKVIKKWSKIRQSRFFLAYWGFTILYTLIAVVLVKFNEAHHSTLK